MILSVRIFFGFVLTVLAATVYGASPVRQFDFLPPYPNSELVYSESIEAPDYRLVVGQLRMVGNEIRSQQRRLRGDLTRLTYQILGGHTSQSAIQHFRAKLAASGAEILFSCASRDCGRSSEWATEVFDIANLYGIDREQNYLVARLTRGSNVYYVVVYTIMRGNQRVYAHLDVLETSAAAADAGAEDSVLRPLIPLREGDFAVALPQALGEFASYAAEQPNQAIWIVVHNSGESYEAAASQGRSIANRIKLWLVARGLAEDRINVLPVGPLAPSHSASVPAERVELFLLNR